MADNPNKKGLDAKRVSQQPHEQAYQRRNKKEEQEGSHSTSGERGAGRGDSSKGSSGRSSTGR